MPSTNVLVSITHASWELESGLTACGDFKEDVTGEINDET